MDAITKLNQLRDNFFKKIHKIINIPQIMKDEIVPPLVLHFIIDYDVSDIELKQFASKIKLTGDYSYQDEGIRKKYNKIIGIINEDQQKVKSAIRKQIKIITNIIGILDLPTNKINIQKVRESVDALNISDDLRFEIEESIDDYIKSKRNNEEKEKLLKEQERLLKIKEEEEKRILEEHRIKEENEMLDNPSKENIKKRIKNFNRIKDIFEENEDYFPDKVFEQPIKKTLDFEDLDVYLGYSSNEFEEDFYIESLLSLFALTDIANNDTDFYQIEDYIYKLSRKYELSLKLSELNLSVLSLFKKSLSKDDSDYALYCQLRLEHLGKELFINDEIELELDEIKRGIQNIENKSEQIEIDNLIKIPINSFILFDYGLTDDGKKVPYILSDLDDDSTRGLIDRSIGGVDLVSNGYEDFNNLIHDLLKFGEPRILHENKKFTYTEKIIRSVFYTKSSYEKVNDSMRNATGMVRIRPTLTSYVRFVDELVKFSPQDGSFSQIINLIESKLPGVYIDRNKEFNILINYMDAFKRTDKEGYRTSINRRDRSRIHDIFKNDRKVFSKEELKEIEKYIDMSLHTYKELEKMNPNFNFDLVKKLKTKGL